MVDDAYSRRLQAAAAWALFEHVAAEGVDLDAATRRRAVAAGIEIADSARDKSLSFTFFPGEVTHPLTTWVDCGVEEGDRAQIGITRIAVPARYAGRVVADPAVHDVDVGNLTPVPAVPTSAAVLLDATLAGLGAVRRHRLRTRATSSVGEKGLTM